MRENQIRQVSIHEAGHAMAYFVLGRPIQHAMINIDGPDEVKPEPEEHIHVRDEAVVAAAGWEAEVAMYKRDGLDEAEFLTEWMNGGHHRDHAELDALAAAHDDVSVEHAMRDAAQIVQDHFPFVEAIATALVDESSIDQARLEELGKAHGLQFVRGRADQPRTAGQA